MASRVTPTSAAVCARFPRDDAFEISLRGGMRVRSQLGAIKPGQICGCDATHQMAPVVPAVAELERGQLVILSQRARTVAQNML